MKHISFMPLWHTLLDRNMRKEDLRVAAGLTTNMIANMGKNKGISIDVIEDKIYVGVELNVSYGTKIPELSGRIQQKIRSSVENMTGMEVAEVNINIASMNIEKTSKEA